MVPCPECGATAQSKATFCPNCGAEMTGSGDVGSDEQAESDLGGGAEPPGHGTASQQVAGGAGGAGQRSGTHDQGNAGGEKPRGQSGKGRRQPGGGDGVSRRTLLAGGGVAALVAAGGGWYFFLRDSGPDGPAGVARSYFVALTNGNAERVNSLLHPDVPVDGEVTQQNLDVFSGVDFSIDSVEVVERTDAEATVQVTFSVRGSSSTAPMRLRKHEGRWLVYTDP